MASFRHGIEHICSAFLISEIHTLTAAHCLDDFMKSYTIPDFSEYSIVVGLSDWTTGGTFHFIKEVEVNHCYNLFERNLNYDIGLITVNFHLK